MEECFKKEMDDACTVCEFGPKCYKEVLGREMDEEELVSLAKSKGHKDGEHLFKYLTEIEMHKYDVLMREEARKSEREKVIEEVFIILGCQCETLSNKHSKFVTCDNCKIRKKLLVAEE